jgi:hypothetical protein
MILLLLMAAVAIASSAHPDCLFKGQQEALRQVGLILQWVWPEIRVRARWMRQKRLRYARKNGLGSADDPGCQVLDLLSLNYDNNA